MPIHDWTRVETGIFHDFHNVWLAGLRNTLNEGLLPPDYYALTEQHAGRYIADILTLHTSPPVPLPKAPPLPNGGTAVAEAPPKVRFRLTASAGTRKRRRTLAVRHVSGHRLVALVEIVSPSNKDRPASVQELADKIVDALEWGVHVLLIDLFPPGLHDLQGIHGVVWQRFDDTLYFLPPGEPFTLASYAAGPAPDVYLEHLAVGAPLSPMPLFLHPERYIMVPLEPTYQAALRGMPAFWRDVLESGDR